MSPIRALSTSSDRGSSERWTVSEMAQQAKCTLRTIRFYEQRGLLSSEARTSGRHRRYSPHDLERLRMVVELRRAGLSLGEIRTLFELKSRHATGAAASTALREMLGQKITVLRARILELSAIQSEFEQLHARLSICEDCNSVPPFPDACAKCERPAAAGDNPMLWALWSHSP